MSKKLNKLVDINGLREFKNKLVGTDSAYVQTGAVDQTVGGTKTFSKPIAGSVTGSSGSCTGNAATATRADSAANADTATNANYANSAGSVAWGNVSGRPTAVSQFSNDSGYITTDGAAYPRRVGGVTMNFNWSGQGGQPTWLWGGEDGTNMYVYNPANFSVNYANSAGYTNWLRTSSHTDHLFHTEWDGTYFWTYVTAGDGGYRAVRVERSNSSGYADSAGPAGVIIPFAGTSVPTGYLLCNGAAVSRTNYANLFAAIGTLYGAGDGSTTFNLPDARDRVLQGASGWHSVGSYIAAGLPNITGYIGQGVQCAAIQITNGAFYESDARQHNAAQNNDGSSIFPAYVYFNASRASTIYGASNTVQSPAIATNFIIKY